MEPINCNKYTTVVGDADNGRGYAFMEARAPMYRLLNFYESKTAVKNKVCYKSKSKGTSQNDSICFCSKSLKKKMELPFSGKNVRGTDFKFGRGEVRSPL